MKLDIGLFQHQGEYASAPWNRDAEGINDIFMVSGYGGGKTYADCALVFNLISRYHKYDVNIGLGATNQTFLKKTLVSELEHLIQKNFIPYTFDQQSMIITINRLRIFCIGMEAADLIYGFNFNCFISDEIDELNHQKAHDASLAIKERTRVSFPDGRLPFRAYTSTSQGYKGLYRLVEGMREKKRPFMLLRAETRMNTLLPQSYIDDLVAAYSPEQRLAWLEGRFVNLTTGRVYPSYDESKHMLKVPPFALETNETISIGQDLNTGYSRGSAVIVRDGVIHVVRVFEFKELAHAPKQIAQAFQGHRILWYPDASGAEIMAGYANEIRAAGIECRIGTVNASVVDRIFFINKLFDMGKLILWPTAAPLAMALKVRTFDKHGDPEKRQGPDDPSHYADSLEYVCWRVVSSDPAFRFLWDLNRGRRRDISDKLVIA
jgi:hypothetical protein